MDEILEKRLPASGFRLPVLGLDHGGPEAGGRKPALQIASPAAEINAADHDFPVACGDQRVHLANNLRQRQRPAVSAHTRDHAEGATVVTSVLHFKVGASPVA